VAFFLIILQANILLTQKGEFCYREFAGSSVFNTMMLIRLRLDGRVIHRTFVYYQNCLTFNYPFLVKFTSRTFTIPGADAEKPNE
jgi:hypothetical protein